MPLWSDTDNRQLVAFYYPEYLDWYDGLSLPIQRADAARIFYIHRYGGVYLDLDFVCLRPLSRALGRHAANTFFVARQRENTSASFDEIANAFIAAPPFHPFADLLLHRMRQVDTTARDDLWSPQVA